MSAYWYYHEKTAYKHINTLGYFQINVTRCIKGTHTILGEEHGRNGQAKPKMEGQGNFKSYYIAKAWNIFNVWFPVSSCYQ